ncbi:MAG: hypothetical protein A2Y45_10335 [Tenericutes bacterium GWC2_34_14]|nr:MAG: hypothetical protein A2Y45_10335 [Tenericutes bacterium GWC2_34_14]OHE33822.1 MAG: hypothetical protein A2012_06875 [Tenericutes bacterium GWE2_34_108]OHE36557.1 MAG: hypothetical protein A2Y46_03685 [Tenericutes bacterium GWF1_35_14]OHE37867.1 MAG: hypothetical protein A2Y44_05595 [Tenericutes bacterium GWF2_35_184]OHE42279.1 MAG: hypothetical protein A3K26_03980 [Tenericutes bacterium RIFOXYA12_FULL_35_10]OHE45321.1 MAG: hypothetical protein A2221_07960 [Tenericutes bacterium RIFOXYA
MEYFNFYDKQAFYEWMSMHHLDNEHAWIRFDKTKKTSSLTPFEALDIALCFGWIDGLIKRIDDQYYVKYFSKRLPKSIWSTQNKMFAERLIKEGRMMPSGYQAIELAKKDGRWDKADLAPEDYNLESFKELIKESDLAFKQFNSFSTSIQKTYAMSYYVLKKTESRTNRLHIIIKRLEQGLKPM